MAAAADAAAPIGGSACRVICGASRRRLGRSVGIGLRWRGSTGRRDCRGGSLEAAPGGAGRLDSMAAGPTGVALHTGRRVDDCRRV